MAKEHLDLIRFNAFLIPAAVGPAIVFSLIWKACNCEIRYIGEGLDGSSATFAAGIICYLFLLKRLWSSEKRHDIPSIYAVASWIAIQIAVAPFSIFAGRIVFSLIPPWSNDWGAVLGFGFGYNISNAFIALPRQRFEPQRGTVVIPEIEAERRTSLLPKTSEPPIRWAGKEYPAEIAFGNIVVAGAVGSGKH